MTRSKKDSTQYALDRLNPERITLGRELRGLTKKALAQLIKKTPSAMGQIERGVIRPDIDTFLSIAFALKMPPSFFSSEANRPPSIDMAACHFRSLRSVSQTMRRQCVRRGELFIAFIELLESKGIVLPKEAISSFNMPVDTNEDIENAAVELRKHWGMQLGPIPNIIKLVESKGIITLPIEEVSRKVDAFSTWIGKRPCIMLSQNKTASRIRFDVGHELGHLVLHEDTAAGDATAERQAHRFAGAFLAPRESFVEECPKRWSLAAFQLLKPRWKMSIQAMVRRAKDLDCISQSTYQRANIQLRSLGMTKNEGPEWEPEKPVLLPQAIELLSDHVTLEELADEMSIFPNQLRDMLSQCVPETTLQRLDRQEDIELADIVKLPRPKL